MNAKSSSTIYSINAVLIALYPVLDIYYWGGLPIGIGSILLLLSGLLSIFITKPSISNKEVVVWMSIMIIVSFLTYLMQSNESWFSSSFHWHNLIVIAYILFIIISSGSRINIQQFLKFGVIIGIIASLICIYQRFRLITTGSFESFYLPGLSMGEDMETKVTTLTRPAAFFTEPAHLSLYVIPMFYYALLSNRPIAAIILAIGALASGSTTGFLLLGLLLLVFLFRKGSKKRKAIYTIFFIVAGLIIIRYAPSILQENVEKFNETDTSENIRLLGGALIWRFFSMTDVIFGIGLNQLENFAMSYSLLLKNYSGALIYTFTCYGLLGLGATIWFIISLFKKSYANIGSILIFLGVFCTDQILFNRNLVFLLIFVECMRRLNEQQSIKEKVTMK